MRHHNRLITTETKALSRGMTVEEYKTYLNTRPRTGVRHGLTVESADGIRFTGSPMALPLSKMRDSRPEDSLIDAEHIREGLVGFYSLVSKQAIGSQAESGVDGFLEPDGLSEKPVEPEQ